MDILEQPPNQNKYEAIKQRQPDAFALPSIFVKRFAFPRMESRTPNQHAAFRRPVLASKGYLDSRE
uniref:Uncharacterized protein n=1 Tax=Ciona intestinalis TaxID=7719 RepID=H2XL22_CIOIN